MTHLVVKLILNEWYGWKKSRINEVSSSFHEAAEIVDLLTKVKQLYDVVSGQILLGVLEDGAFGHEVQCYLTY